MLPEQFRDMTTEQRRAHFARLRERNKKTVPANDPLAESRARIRLNAIIQQEYTMKKTVSGKADLADIATASLSAAAKIEAIRKAYIPARDAILHEHDATLAALSPQDRLQTQKKLQPSIDAKIKELQAKTAEARAAIITDLKTAKTLADEYGPHLGDARTVASMFQITSDTRQRVNQQIANAGPAVLRSAAVQAKMLLADPKTAHEGKVLAAEVLARNSALDKAYRIWKPEEAKAYAAEIFEIEVSDIANYETGIARSLAMAMAAEREITGEGTSPLAKLTLGLKHPGEKIVPRDDIDNEGSNDLPTDKISAGLAALKA